MKLSYDQIHSQFKLNGTPCDKEALKEVGYDFIKEGTVYEVGIGNFLMDWLDGQPTIEVKTSGSTGKPKLITLEKQHMVNSAIATGDFFGLKAGDTALHCLPTDFIAGKMMLVRAIVLGLELDYVEPSSQPLSNTDKIYDFCAMVPLQLEASLDKIHQIKKLIVGGAPIPDHLKKQVQNKTTQIYETYGMTETITHIAAKKINQLPPVTSSTIEKSFKTLPNIVVSKDDRDCLVIDAPNIVNGPIITNDVVKIISNREFEWLGRYDNVINSGGIKLFPEQIEAKLSPILDIRFFTIGLSDEKLGQKLVLVVEGEIDPIELLEKIESSGRLKKFETPKDIFSVKKFTETENGKIQRDKTLEQLLKQ